MKKDYQVNDTIFYGLQICSVNGVEERSFSGEKKLYYILQPIYHDSSVIYVPADNEKLTSRMRPMLSAEEIRALIRSIPENRMEWIENETARKDKCRAILSSGDRRALVGLIHTFYRKKVEREAAGKKMRISDERILKEAERLISDEFSLVLHICPEEVLPFIMKEMDEKTK